MMTNTKKSKNSCVTIKMVAEVAMVKTEIMTTEVAITIIIKMDIIIDMTEM